MNSSSFIIGADDIGPRYLQNISKVIEMKLKQSEMLKIEKDLLRNQLRMHAGRSAAKGWAEYGASASTFPEAPVLRNSNSESPKPIPRGTVTPLRTETLNRSVAFPALSPVPKGSSLRPGMRFKGRPRTLRNPITGAETPKWYE